MAIQKKETGKSAIWKTVAKALFLMCLTAGSFYLGWHLYTARNSETMVCLTMMSEDGLFIYKYQGSGAAEDAGENGSAEGSGQEQQGEQSSEPDGTASLAPETDWGFVSFGERMRVTGVSGNRIPLEDIYTQPQQKAVVKVVIGPDGKISGIYQIPEAFAITGEVESTEDGAVYISGQRYVLADDVAFGWSQGDVVEVYGVGDEIIYASLVDKAGLLRVVSNVEGAKVFVDGDYKGEAPVTVNIAPGMKQVMVKAAGYKTFVAQVEVNPGQESEVTGDLVLVTGTLQVTSSPEGANVLVNNELRGTTPLSIPLPPGEYQITVEKSGYYPRKATLRVVQDTTTPVHFGLVAQSTVTSPIGTITPGSPSREPQVEGTRMIVLGYDRDTRVLQVMDSSRIRSKLVVPNGVLLETLPSGRTSWDRLLPGEEIVVVASASGYVEKATKVYSHTFTASGKVFAKDGQVFNVGDNWTRCVMSPNVLIHSQADNVLVRDIQVGDTVTAYGSSSDDIRFVVIEDTLGIESSFEGYLVNTGDSLRVFSESALLSLTVPGTIDVANTDKRVTDKASAVPSGSKLRFYQDRQGKIVFAEYVWKAEVSLEGQVGLMSGPALTILPSWKEVTVSLNTTVFVEDTRRPFYDVRTGDTVLVAGPSQVDTGFIWVKHRMSWDRVAEGFMGGGQGSNRRVFTEVDRKGVVTQWVLDATFTVVDAKQGKHMLASQLNNGDKVRVWLDAAGKPVWGEMIEANAINLTGHYLGEDGQGYWYFTGLRKFKPADNIVVTGLFKDEVLRPGSRVHVGGDGTYVNYIEVQQLAETGSEPDDYGTIVSVDKNAITLMRKIWTDVYSFTDYSVQDGARYVDWEAGVDGDARDLSIGDHIEIYLSPDDRVVFIERTYSPRFRVQGTVTAVSESNNAFTITGEYGTLRVELSSTAVVYKGGGRVHRSEIQPGDKVHVSGSSADSVLLVVVIP